MPYLQLLVEDANHILQMLRHHSGRDLARIGGYVIVARSIDRDGKLRAHTLVPEGQSPETTEQLLAEARVLTSSA